MKHEYDFLVVGAGLFGATFACMAKQRWQEMSGHRQAFPFGR